MSGTKHDDLTMCLLPPVSNFSKVSESQVLGHLRV